MSPSFWAGRQPTKAAVISTSGAAPITWLELEQRSNQLARWWRANGIARGDHVALLLENNVRYYEVLWAALRSGLYLTPINRFLSVDEAIYILDDCGATCLITSQLHADAGRRVAESRQRLSSLANDGRRRAVI